jgi:hypothetical protein
MPARLWRILMTPGYEASSQAHCWTLIPAGPNARIMPGIAGNGPQARIFFNIITFTLAGPGSVLHTGT